MHPSTNIERLFRLLLVAPLIASVSAAQQLTTTLIEDGFARPVWVTSPPDDTQRLFVVEQHTGRIEIIKNGVLQATPFLTVRGITTGEEQGLLGLAFHPDYASNGRFFINCTVPGGGAAGHTEIREHTVSTDPAIAKADFTVILAVDQPQSNHNGGNLEFGPLDGFLYIGLGDGGNANDTGTGHVAGGNAQSLATNLGKMLRLDVDNPGTYVAAGNPFGDLIWASGLRNPWRYSFDRLNGDLYIADVGQNAWEEIDFQAGTSPGGENYGWRCMEGAHCTGLTGCTCLAPNLVLPIQEYGHTAGNCSIIGGYVYRGVAIPALYGTYFYADYCSGTIWTFEYVGGVVTKLTDRTAQLEPAGAPTIDTISSFGVDARGEIYICDQGGGEIYRIDSACPAPATYCDTSPNSAGPGARMSFVGTGQISLNNLVLTTTGCPPSTTGIYFFGDGQTQVALGNGLRCVARNIVRLPVAQSSSLGQASWSFDFNAGYASGIAPGMTKNFQYWYRDNSGGGAQFNLSDALGVPICQ